MASFGSNEPSRMVLRDQITLCREAVALDARLAECVGVDSVTSSDASASSGVFASIDGKPRLIKQTLLPVRFRTRLKLY